MIDRLVYELYGLTVEEVKIVDKDMIELHATIICPLCGFAKNEQMLPDT
jgi:hypothetical protein